MVGNIGALRTAPVGPIEKATELAMGLIHGWAKKEHDKFSAILTELNEAAKNNAEVYKQASTALNDLSRRENAARDLQARARAAHDEAAELLRSAHEQVTTARNALAGEQEAHVARVTSDNDSLQERERKVKVRESVAERAQGEADKMQRSFGTKIAIADRLAADAQATIAKIDSKFRRVKNIIEEA